jgi:flagellar protein FlgJ
VTINSTASLGLPLATPLRPGDDPKKIKDTAQQFESLLIGQMLKTSREAGGSGWLGTGDDEAGSTAVEMAEQQVAQMLASHGGLGLARLIEQGLSRSSPSGPDPSPTPAPTRPGSGE